MATPALTTSEYTVSVACLRVAWATHTAAELGAATAAGAGGRGGGCGPLLVEPERGWGSAARTDGVLSLYSVKRMTSWSINVKRVANRSINAKRVASLSINVKRIASSAINVKRIANWSINVKLTSQLHQGPEPTHPSAPLSCPRTGGEPTHLECP